MNKRGIGTRILYAADRKGLTEKELAKRVLITTSMMNNYCKGRSQMSYETLIAIARELEVSTDYLFGLDEYREAKLGEPSGLDWVQRELTVMQRETERLLDKIKRLQKAIEE